MKTPPTFFGSITFTLASVLAFAFPQRAFCEDKSHGAEQALLEEAKKSELEHKMAGKQSVVDRLKEDQKNEQQEIDELDKSRAKVSKATADAAGRLESLGADQKRMTRDLESLGKRMAAEKIKIEGLRLLGIANAKRREALAKRSIETGLKTKLAASEVRILAAKSGLDPVAAGPSRGHSKQEPTLTELRKELAKAEQATINANSIARQALEAASEKLRQADAVGAKTGSKRTSSSKEDNQADAFGNDPLNPTKP